MALKSIQRSATVAFAPMAQIMGVGTMAGAIDLSFSSSASLELLKLDFASTELDLPVLGSCVATERFNRLSWSNIGAGSLEEYPLGLIAGGLADGSIHLWNPAKLASGDEAEREASSFNVPQTHTGAVRGLEFNTFTPNLLASGGDDGDLYVWDVSNPAAASNFPSLRGGVQGELSFVAWNWKVQHILASTSYSGTSVVWDLRRQKPVISFTDPTSRRRCSTLQWNPEVATQLIVASDDDRSPALQVWDLRNSVSPLKEFVGHTKGVLAMAWCPNDSSLLLTCAKDNRTLCWDTASGEVLCELPASGNWNFDVQWSPCTPGVLSTSSFDGKVGIYNIEACSRTTSTDPFIGGGINSSDYSTALRKAPKWLKRPVGVNFGFGGKLVSFAPKKVTPGAAAASSEVKIHSLITEEGLVKRSTEFEEAIAGGERSALRNFCESKASAVTSEEEKETWSFLKIMFDEEARRQLLTHFGFSSQPSENGTSDLPEDENLGNEELKGDSPTEEPKSAPVVSVNENILESTDDGEDFFDKLETPQTPTEPNGPSIEANYSRDDESAEPEAVAAEPVKVEAGGEGESQSEEAIQRALVAGDFQAAVDHCLAAGRMADALVMAAVGGTALWEKTQNEYIRRTKRPYLKVVAAVVNNDLQGLVETRPLKAWKETLALLCTYAQSEEWTQLCDALGARLDVGHEVQAAILCYICSGNIEKAVGIWSRTLDSKNGGRDFVDVLQDVMEKSVVLGLATGTKQVSASLARLVCYYAELLASQGLLSIALDYLKLVPTDDSSQELTILRDRISHSSQEIVADNKVEGPSFPYEKEYQAEPHSTLAQEPIQYNMAPQQQSYYSRDPYQSEGTSSPSYQSHYPQVPQVPQVQPLSNLYPTGPTPSIYYSNQPPQTNYSTPSQASRPLTGFVPSVPQPQQVTGFVPTAPPPTPSFEAYQQPQMAPPAQPYQGSGGHVPYPGANSQQPSVMMPGLAITSMPPPPPPTVGFMPVSTPSNQAVAAQEPPSPQAGSSNSSSASFAPASTVQTADTSNVAAELKPVVATLTRLFNETSEAVGGSKAPPVKKREIEDNSKKLGALFVKLNSADLSANASVKLGQLCQALNVGDYATALQIQVALTTSDWDECSFWLAALKRMIKTRQSMR